MEEVAVDRQVINGRYRVDGRLGEGAQAVVLRVHDLRDGVDRALKRMLPACAQRPKLRARFEAEARSMVRIDDPHVVRVTEVATDGALPYFVMELVPGGSLAGCIERGGPLAPRLAVRVTQQLCRGLSAAHAIGVVHRDVKPHNVLVSPDGTCKLTDFGIARVEEGLRTRAGASLGTEGFMAPEQAADATSVDARADVYGVGMTAFVLLTAHDPFAWITGRAEGAVPEPLRPILARATEDLPDRRWDSAEALSRALEAVIDALPDDPPDAALALRGSDDRDGDRTPSDAMTRIEEEPTGATLRPRRPEAKPRVEPIVFGIDAPAPAPAPAGNGLLKLAVALFALAVALVVGVAAVGLYLWLTHV